MERVFYTSICFLFHLSGSGSCRTSRQGPASLLMKDSGCVLALPLGEKTRERRERERCDPGKTEPGSIRSESRSDSLSMAMETLQHYLIAAIHYQLTVFNKEPLNCLSVAGYMHVSPTEPFKTTLLIKMTQQSCSLIPQTITNHLIP